MSAQLDQFDRICRFVFSEPKFRAQVEWHRDYGIASQLANQWPRQEMEDYVAEGCHAVPDRRISLVVDEMPDFDWWEPRYDQPFRRQQARYRKFGL